MNYKIKQKKIDNLDFFIDDIKSLEISTKINGVDSIKLYNEELISTFIDEFFLRKFKDLAKFVIDFLNNDDSSDSDALLVLNQTKRLEAILLNKYKEHIKESKLKKMLKEIYILEQKIKSKNAVLLNRKTRSTVNYMYMDKQNDKNKSR